LKINIASNNKFILESPGVKIIEESNKLNISWVSNLEGDEQPGIIGIEFAIGSKSINLQ